MASSFERRRLREYKMINNPSPKATPMHAPPSDRRKNLYDTKMLREIYKLSHNKYMSFARLPRETLPPSNIRAEAINTHLREEPSRKDLKEHSRRSIIHNTFPTNMHLQKWRQKISSPMQKSDLGLKR